MTDNKSSTQEDVKTPDTKATSLDVNTEDQRVPYSRFKEVLDKSKEYEDRLKVLESDTLAAKRKVEEDQLKAKGDYEKLIQLNTEETSMAITSAKKTIEKAFFAQLGAKHGIVDEDGLRMFSVPIEFADDYSIKNQDAIEKAFEEFKVAKPYLFKTDTKQVPRVDNSPNRKVQIESSNLTQQERVALAAQKMVEDYKSRSK